MGGQRRCSINVKEFYLLEAGKKKNKNRSQRLNRVNSVSCSYYMSSARQWEALIHTVMQGTRLTENLSSCSCAIWTTQHLWLLQKGKKEVEEDACQLLTVSARQ